MPDEATSPNPLATLPQDVPELPQNFSNRVDAQAALISALLEEDAAGTLSPRGL